jgi:hypothetical protein
MATVSPRAGRMSRRKRPSPANRPPAPHPRQRRPTTRHNKNKNIKLILKIATMRMKRVDQALDLRTRELFFFHELDLFFPPFLQHLLCCRPHRAWLTCASWYTSCSSPWAILRARSTCRSRPTGVAAGSSSCTRRQKRTNMITWKKKNKIKLGRVRKGSLPAGPCFMSLSFFFPFLPSNRFVRAGEREGHESFPDGRHGGAGNFRLTVPQQQCSERRVQLQEHRKLARARGSSPGLSRGEERKEKKNRICLRMARTLTAGLSR